ncbi:uncharacterized protein LOC108713397 [Xenopus laevis]|nr:uncharacterized protein LOC108713397 [Xenopus laevis]
MAVYDEEKAIEQSAPPKSKINKRAKGKKLKKKKRDCANQPVETAVTVEATPNHVLATEEKCTVPDEVKSTKAEHVVPSKDITTEKEYVAPDNVCPSGEETPRTPKYKRVTILQWIDETTDEEDDEQTDLEQTLQAPKKYILPLTAVNFDQEKSVVPESHMSSDLKLPTVTIEDDDDEEWLNKPTGLKQCVEDVYIRENKCTSDPISVTVQIEEDGEESEDLKKMSDDIKSGKYEITESFEEGPYGIMLFRDGEKNIYLTNLPVDKIVLRPIGSAPIKSMQGVTKALKEAEAESKSLDKDFHGIGSNYEECTKHREPIEILIFQDDGEDPVEITDLPSDTAEMIMEHILSYPFEKRKSEILLFQVNEKAIYVTNLPKDKAKITMQYIRSLPPESMHDIMKTL